MDPNANLAEQRRIIAQILDSDDGPSADWSRLAELQRALDEWLQNGGFLPDAWQH